MFQIKVCGITRKSDLEAAVEVGVDAVGLNFAPVSSRFLQPQQAADLLKSTPAPIVRVGVFVNASPQHIGEVCEWIPLDMIQLHGDEPPELLADLPSIGIIRAFRYGGNVKPVGDYLDACQSAGRVPDAVLLDAAVSGEYGGTGSRLEWQKMGSIAERLAPVPFVLAGGLNVANVSGAIHHARPAAVDVASGVEDGPGRRNVQQMRDFVRAARQALEVLGRN